MTDPSLHLLIAVALLMTAQYFTLIVLYTLRKATMTTQDAVDAIVTQLANAKAEILDELAAVQAQLEDAEAADKVDLSGLTAIAQALDDVVPDAPAETPTEVESDEADEVDDDEADALPIKGDGDRA